MAGLGEVDGVAEIVYFEQRLFVFACHSGKDWGVYQCEAVVVEEPADGIDEGVTYFTDAPLAVGTQVQVAVLEQKIRAVRFWGDWVAICVGNYFCVSQGQFMAADASFVRADKAGYNKRGFCAEAFQLVKCVIRDFAFFGYALAHAGAVTNDQELYLAAGAAAIKPAGKSDFFSNVVF